MGESSAACSGAPIEVLEMDERLLCLAWLTGCTLLISHCSVSLSDSFLDSCCPFELAALKVSDAGVLSL